MKSICDILICNGLKISVAESFTGGGLASEFISMQGASAFFSASIVAYTDNMKHSLLGVPQDVLKNYGAVSEECAKSMAIEIVNKTGSDISVATTGFAGPATDSDTLPVGTFYIAVSDGINTVVRKYYYNGTRREVTSCGVAEAITLLRSFLEDRYN